MTAQEWTRSYCRRLGIPPPSEEEVELLLELAGVAAHASERVAAPVACWLAARAGLGPGVALERARNVASG